MPALVRWIRCHGGWHLLLRERSRLRTCRAIRLVISAIRRLNPEIPLWVRTSAPPWLFPSDVAVEPSELDLGVLQRGSLHVRPRDTLEEYARLIHSEESRIENEIGLARTRRMTCVVADIPSAAFEVASKLDVPSIGVANFCWHWVYQPYARRFPELVHVVRHIEQQEGLATVLLRLPFAWDFNCFQQIRDVPLIGRSAEHSRSETRMRLGIEAERRVALLSFGGYGFDGLGQERLNRLKDWLFLTTESTSPPGRRRNIQNVVQPSLSYVDILAASDVVVTKPGFGIVSDALVNRIPVLYSDRGEFREYGVLARGLRSLGRAKYIPRPDLERGRLGPYLEALMDNDRPWSPLDWSGADVIARQVLESAR